MHGGRLFTAYILSPLKRNRRDEIDLIATHKYYIK